jgi:hypothetical protein
MSGRPAPNKEVPISQDEAKMMLEVGLLWTTEYAKILVPDYFIKTAFCPQYTTLTIQDKSQCIYAIELSLRADVPALSPENEQIQYKLEEETPADIEVMRTAFEKLFTGINLSMEERANLHYIVIRIKNSLNFCWNSMDNWYKNEVKASSASTRRKLDYHFDFRALQENVIIIADRTGREVKGMPCLQVSLRKIWDPVAIATA